MAKQMSQTRSSSREPRWEDEVDWQEFSNKITLMRIVGLVTVRKRFWIQTLTGKSFPMWSTKFDPDTEEDTLDNPCPMYDDFGIYGQKILIFNAIIRDLQEKGDPNGGVRGIIWPAGVKEDLDTIIERIKVDPADPEQGIDLAVKYNAAASGSSKWTIQRDDRTPLKPRENPDSPECECTYYDFDALAEDFKGYLPDEARLDGESDGDFMTRRKETRDKAKEYAATYARRMKDAMARYMWYVVQVAPIDENDPWKSFKGDVNGQPWQNIEVLAAVEKAREDAKDGKGGTASSQSTGGGQKDADLPSNRGAAVDTSEAPSRSEVEPDAPAQAASAQSATAASAPEGGLPQIHPDAAIKTVAHATFGNVPECYTKYTGKAACHKCPVKVKCIDLMEDE
jgi:hypothetical protein